MLQARHGTQVGTRRSDEGGESAQVETSRPAIALKELSLARNELKGGKPYLLSGSSWTNSPQTSKSSCRGGDASFKRTQVETFRPAHASLGYISEYPDLHKRNAIAGRHVSTCAQLSQVSIDVLL